MSIINATPLLAAAGGDYQISRSVRLRSSASAYLSRTPASNGSQTTWTWSAWFKRGLLTYGGTASVTSLFGWTHSVAGQSGEIGFSNSAVSGIGDNIFLAQGASIYRVTNAVFRDPSAWYHIVVVWDTTNATDALRARIYINGVLQTYASAPSIALNTTLLCNSTVAHNLAADPPNGGSVRDFFDGYLTEVNFIDGQALTPSSFGQYNAYGVWTPTKYNGTYGTNGFYLNFSDNSGATATTIGKDYSGNGNNWTPNNISVTAGVTYDSMLDVPTPWGDGGNGRGNYTTLNPLKGFGGLNSSGNLNITNGSSAFVTTIAAPQSGKWYFEFSTPGNTTSTNCGVFARPMDSVLSAIGDVNTASTTYYRNDGALIENGSTVATYTAWSTGANVIGVALDMDAKTIRYYLNNTAQGASARNLLSTTSDYTVAIYNYISGQTLSCNYGQQPFAYTPPSGFNALNTFNLPTPTIGNGANYMAATTYTGNGSTLTVTNGGNNTLGTIFKPDFVWIKDRTGANNHCLFDSVRGVYILLNSNATAADQTFSTSLTSFNSNGFSLGSYGNVNLNSSSNYIAWQWQAGQGTTSSNTAGSITSTVSVNATAGFSVVAYTANGASAQTIGHGLGVAPSMIITKCRSAGSSNWGVYHKSIGNTGAVFLNATNATATSSLYWNNTSPTSTVFSVGSNNTDTNYSTNTMVAYCWAEVAGFSKFGSYTGNGSATGDGPFVYCGFRPRWVMLKPTVGTGSWIILDTARDTYNVEGNMLFSNESTAETASPPRIDALSNGFKARAGAGSAPNVSGEVYIYAAFAENPFKLALAR